MSMGPLDKNHRSSRAADLSVSHAQGGRCCLLGPRGVGRWMAAMSKDYPEHFAAGLEAHGVREKYYFARGPQLVNRVVDTSSSTIGPPESNIEAEIRKQAVPLK